MKLELGETVISTASHLRLRELSQSKLYSPWFYTMRSVDRIWLVLRDALAWEQRHMQANLIREVDRQFQEAMDKATPAPRVEHPPYVHAPQWREKMRERLKSRMNT